jgi:hypothetical protein
MKFQLLEHKPPYFFTKLIYPNQLENRLELVKPKSELRSTTGLIENILRWEDDGGKIMEFNHLAFTRKEQPNV